MKPKFYYTLILASFLVFVACKKEKETTNSINSTDELITATDNNRGETESNTIFTMSKGGWDRRLGAKTNGTDTFDVPSCAVETLDTLSNPKKYIIDFGQTGCECFDGKTRKGRLILTWTGNPWDSLSQKQIIADSFFINNVRWTYQHRETNLGRKPPMGHPVMRVEVLDCKIMGADGVVDFKSDRTQELVRGHETPMIFSDDEFMVKGATNGSDRKGNVFSTIITQPLKFRPDCRYFTSGKVELRRNNSEVRTLDYGSGNCDNEATMIIQGKSYPFTLK
jgi:hypothetical protein